MCLWELFLGGIFLFLGGSHRLLAFLSQLRLVQLDDWVFELAANCPAPVGSARMRVHVCVCVCSPNEAKTEVAIV